MRPLKVSEVNNYIKKIFATDMILSNVEIEGEISNYNHHYSGHRYFSLKDSSGRIKCVMFKGYGQGLEFEMEEGQKIIAKGSISVYEKTGEYQLYVRSVEEQGVGDLYRKYEELKNKLKEEGLFKEEFKKPIPEMPKTIGIVTSATSAAVQDMINVTHRRFPACNIVIYPSLVQGDEAAKRITEGVKYLDNMEDIDLIIIGRGGGSIDELFAFNDETLARTIFACKTPLISAVGHETDFTISDFVSDLRAPTPSAAAELAVPNIVDLNASLDAQHRRMEAISRNLINSYRSRLDIISKGIKYNSPLYKLRDRRQELDMMSMDMSKYMEAILNQKRHYLRDMDKKLQLLNPSIGLDKGLAILLDKDDKVLRSIDDIKESDTFTVALKDGRIEAVAKSVSREEKING